MQGLHSLSELYYQEKSNFKKEKLLLKIFRLYSPLIKKLCLKYKNLISDDDLTQHIHIGIYNGLENRKEGISINSSIFYHIKSEISDKVIKVLTAQKRYNRYEGYYDINNYQSIEQIKECDNFYVNEEDNIITRIDIEMAVNKLPIKQKNIFNLWFQGYSVIEIKEVIGKKSNQIIYSYLKRIKQILQEELVDYATVA
jgi:RNA polymerase sigma factor (sigma-70 family)